MIPINLVFQMSDFRYEIKETSLPVYLNWKNPGWSVRNEHNKLILVNLVEVEVPGSQIRLPPTDRFLSSVRGLTDQVEVEDPGPQTSGFQLTMRSK